MTESLQPLGSLAVGTVIAGRYELLELLGTGGMGEVYKARHTEMHSIVALKWLRPEMAPNTVAVQRLQAEAKSLASLNHPAIPKVACIEQTAEGGLFVVMEYIQGISLDKELAGRGKIPTEETVDIVCQIADALLHAHKNGIVHRDVKPSNVMLHPVDNKVDAYLLDFGIAKQIQSSQKFTQTGALLGSVRYMSPEQASGGTVDVTTDVYSLGCLTYEMLTGRAPYEGGSAMEVLMQHVQSTVPKIEDSALNEVLMKAMAKAPGERFKSIDEFAQALRAPHTVAPSNREQRRAGSNTKIRSRVVLASAAAAAVFLGFGTWNGLQQHLLQLPQARTEQQENLEKLRDAVSERRSSSPALERVVSQFGDYNVPMDFRARALGLEYAGQWKLVCGETDKAVSIFDKLALLLHEHARSAGIPAKSFAKILLLQKQYDEAHELLEKSIDFDKKHNLEKTWDSVNSQIFYGGELSNSAKPIPALKILTEAMNNSTDERHKSFAKLWIADINSMNGNDEAAKSITTEWLKRQASTPDPHSARFVPWAEYILLKSTLGRANDDEHYRQFNQIYDKQMAAIQSVRNGDPQFFNGDDIQFMFGRATFIARDASGRAKRTADSKPTLENTKRCVEILSKQLRAAEQFEPGWRAATENDYQVWSSRLKALESH